MATGLQQLRDLKKGAAKTAPVSNKPAPAPKFSINPTPTPNTSLVKADVSPELNSASLQTVVGKDAPNVPRTVDEARKLQKENPSMWQRISTNLMKPIGVVATLTEEVGKTDFTSMDSIKSTIKNTPGKIGGILTGTRKRTFTDIWQEEAPKVGIDSRIATAVGLITDIAADPLNFVGGGLTKAGKVINKASELKKIGQVIKADSKLAAQIKALGLTDDLLVMGATKAEQAQKGQRALLTIFANTRFEKTLIKGTGLYKRTALLKTGFQTSRVGETLRKVFSTKTTDEGFNVVKNHFDNLLEYRKGKVMDEALEVQNTIAKFSKEEAVRVLDVIETGKQSGIAAIDDVAKRLKGNLDEILKVEKKLGLVETSLQDYFPHIKLKEGTSLKNRLAKLFYDPKKYSTALGSSKERKILKFAAEDGEELIGKASQLGLRELKNGKFVIGKKGEKGYKVFTAIKEGGEMAGIDKAGINEINQVFGTEFFDSRPAVAFAQRALGSARAVTSKQFLTSVKQFASNADNAVPVAAKELKGMKFLPDVARQIDDYVKIADDSSVVRQALKKFDSVQNWWKAQALVAPSYHIRNMAGNTWNNFLAGVVDPKVYYQAGAVQSGKAISFVDDVGRSWNTQTILKAAKKVGVINEGWYAKDIAVALGDELGGISYNPLKQNFALFRANRAAGSALENNARLAHFIQRLKEGQTIDNAAMSVKKFLFDYGDLTGTEKELFKRLVPFYTWTRKNLPLQFEQAFKQPGKFAAIPKTTEAIESTVDKPNEKFLGDYIKDNIGVRVGSDKEGNTYYFLLGNWLPAAQAIDFLSQPVDNMIQMISPFLKTPGELWANKSTFFDDTLGQDAPIERYPQENQSFVGLTMRKKTAYVLKNIRILNELDKLNPGAIFGDNDNPSLANRIAPEMGFRAPFGIGHITTAEKRTGRYTKEIPGAQRVIQSMFGKSVPYNPSLAKKFYLWDTEAKIRELEKAITDARRDGQKEYAKRLREELNKFRKSR